MSKNDDDLKPVKDIAIASADFCWETEVYSGWVLHYYGDKDDNLVSYPTPKEIASHKK